MKKAIFLMLTSFLLDEPAVMGQSSIDLMPKVELHLHLDCSLSYEVVKVLQPGISFDDYKARFIAPSKCTDLADYIKRAVSGVELMQTKESLQLVTLDLFKQLKADNVVYAEIRFAPLLHINQGLSPDEVVATVLSAMKEGIKTYEIEAGLILCTLRHFSESQSLETASLVQKYRNKGVVGFDMAADEAGFPIDNHIKAFQLVNKAGIPCTAHAGEAKGAASVWETMKNLHPKRIGHGVRSIEDSKLIEYLKKQDIHLEICPTSNVQTNIYPTIQEHVVDKLYEMGVSISINTDARTISNVSLTKEYNTLVRHFNWGKEEFLKINLEAIRHSFTSKKIKDRIEQKLKTAY
jgi:adenosine deaminase